MRIAWRTTGSALLRDVALVCLADGIVGVSFGATAVAGGMPWWVPVAMSVLVFAGGAQIAAVGVVLAGGSPLAAVVAGGVLNTRLFPYGLAVADVVGRESAKSAGSAPESAAGADSGQLDATEAADYGRGADSRRGTVPGRRRWWVRLLGAHVITDESVAFALRQTDQAARRKAFWTCGLALFAVWNVAVGLGELAGSMIKNTNAFGLDATFPAVMLALALPTLREWRTRTAAGTGAAIAVALTPVLPAGLPVLAALGGLATLWRPRRRPGGVTGTGTSDSPGSGTSGSPGSGTSGSLGVTSGSPGGGRQELPETAWRKPDGVRRESRRAGRLDADDSDGLLTGGDR